MIPAVDGHQHFWDTRRVPLPWLRPAHAAIAGPFTPDELEPQARAAGINRTILVQSANLAADTDAMLEMARRHAWIAAVVAWLPLEEAERTRERLAELEGDEKVRGVRHLIHDEPDPHWILRPPVLESLSLVADRKLVLELPAVWPRHLGDVPELARSFPAMTIVIDHLGKPPLGGDGFEDWARALRAAAAEPNVAAKISGLNTATAERDWSAADFEAPVRVAVEAFGPGRLLCGSDWPVSLLNGGDYERVWRETRRAVATAAPAAQELLLAETATRLYRLSTPGEEDRDGAH
jgi:L-fuconolactonase